MSYSIGERYWVPHDEHAWLVGTLKEFKNAVLEFQTDKGVIKLRVPDLKQKLEPCGSHIEDFVENLVDLDELSEGAILHHIRNRFNRKHIYTHVGSILVAVNPFENLDIYGERDIRRAQEAVNAYPHVFVTAATAYTQLQENRRNQSVLISGESGAGKTETTKKVLTYLANVAPDVKVKSAGEPGMETKILQSNPLLEALGNAKTLRNSKSHPPPDLLPVQCSSALFAGGPMCASVCGHFLPCFFPRCHSLIGYLASLTEQTTPLGSASG